MVQYDTHISDSSYAGSVRHGRRRRLRQSFVLQVVCAVVPFGEWLLRGKKRQRVYEDSQNAHFDASRNNKCACWHGRRSYQPKYSRQSEIESPRGDSFNQYVEWETELQKQKRVFRNTSVPKRQLVSEFQAKQAEALAGEILYSGKCAGGQKRLP